MQLVGDGFAGEPYHPDQSRPKFAAEELRQQGYGCAGELIDTDDA